MTVDHRQHHLENIRAGIGVVLYPLHYLTNLPWSSGRWLAEGISTRQQLQEENASLRAQQLLLKARLQKFDALMAENIRLRKLLDTSFNIGERMLIAELLAIDLEPFTRQIVISKGSRFGVYAGQPILDSDGIMGQVVQVTPLTSTAMLITDPSHAIPVAVNRNGLRAIALGTGVANVLEIPHILKNADIKVGDLLVTSGLAGRFPSGYPVGKVISVKDDPNQPFATVIAEPTAQLERSREVLLIWPQQQKVQTVGPCDENDPTCGNNAGASEAAKP